MSILLIAPYFSNLLYLIRARLSSITRHNRYTDSYNGPSKRLTDRQVLTQVNKLFCPLDKYSYLIKLNTRNIFNNNHINYSQCLALIEISHRLVVDLYNIITKASNQNLQIHILIIILITAPLPNKCYVNFINLIHFIMTTNSPIKK